MPTVDELRAAIVAAGDEVKSLKAAGTAKDKLQPHIDKLLALKEEFKAANGGVPFDPPKEDKKKEKAPAAQQQPERTGPSKKELKKAEKKEKKAAAKADAKQGGSGAGAPASKQANGAPATAAAAAAVTGVARAPVAMAKPTLTGDTVFVSAGRAPAVAYATALLTKAGVDFAPHPGASGGVVLEPQLFLMDGTTLFGDLAIARFLARRAGAGAGAEAGGGSGQQLLGAGAFEASEVDQWLDFAQQYSGGAGGNKVAAAELPTLLATLDAHLKPRTYLVGHALSLADVAVLALLQAHRARPAAAALPSLGRWVALLQGGHGEVAAALDKAMALGRPARGGAGAGGGGGVGGKSVSGGSGTCPPLEGAEQGKVVTRFPPEPSGYLHIGHAKAVLLNDYYARHYGGKLIVRFDDTNPAKEKDEFEESIIADLRSLGVVGDMVTHTSDYFDLLQGYAEQMIREGKAFMDNTPQEQMQAERLERKESKNRNTPVELNLERFKLMLEGSKEFCMRAKIDMTSVNGTMRDPVMYRANPTMPHHRTGSKYKAYPTYDLACPIVDSIEGVTHALRTTEYNDRDEQYYWIQKALGLRPVKIQSYSRLNFVQTELSKRKLTWFVENKHVEGWNDPRFPTVQGVMRRGVSIDALRQFILSQGASRRVVLMEWDAFWSLNKKGYEASAPRYMAVFKDSAVPLDITNGPAEPSGMTIPLHPKRPELGSRVLRLAKRVFLEGPDADGVKEGEEITLTRWGNVKIGKVERDAAGKAVRLTGEYNAAGDPRSTEKKLTWLADVPDVVEVVLTEFDYLITKKKLEEGEDFKDFLNPVTKAEVAGLGDPALRNLQKGEVIQLERRGFYICDRPYLGPDKPPVLFMIPDGKTKAMSTLAGALKHV